MKVTQILLAIVFGLALAVPDAKAHSIARGPVKDLFNEADVVAYVEITEGHVAASGYAAYTATVVEAFKGAAEGDTITLGPYRGYAVGLTYLAFLKHPVPPDAGRVGASVAEETSDLGPYDRILSEGMGMMDFTYVVEYSEYGVNVASGALVPKELRRGAVRGYVSKNALATYLRSLATGNERRPAPN